MIPQRQGVGKETKTTEGRTPERNVHAATDPAHLREWTSKLATGKAEMQPRLHIRAKGSEAPAKSRNVCVVVGGGDSRQEKYKMIH